MAKNFRSLNRKLIFVVLFYSSLVTTLMFSMTLALEYMSELQLLEQDISYIERSFVPNLELSVWTMDEIQIRSQIHGILTSQNVVRASVRGDKMHDFDESKDITQYNEVFQREYELFHRADEKAVNIGHLVLYLTKDQIYKRIQDSIIRIFFSQSLKTFIISFILILAFKQLVSRHLRKISDYVRTHRVATDSMEPLLLDKVSNSNYDEIDLVVDSINSMYAKSLVYQKELIELKEQAQNSSQIKNLFLASMSHELRTPLNAILGMTDLLKEAQLPEEYRKYVEVQQKTGEHLRHLIDDILDLSKIEAGELKIEEEVYSIYEVFQICETMVRNQVYEKENTLDMLISTGFPPAIYGDKNRVMQIILNLLTNANKFTTKKRILLSLTYDPLHMKIEVADQGIGISKSDLVEIFSPFRQAKNALNISHKGAGIGLAICKRLAEQMGGNIEVTSEVEVGSHFYVTLPLREAPIHLFKPGQMNNLLSSVANSSTTIKNESTVSPKVEVNAIGTTETKNTERLVTTDNEGKKILVAEDNLDNQILLKAYLKNQNYKIVFANDGEEVVNLFMKNKFDLIYMDLQMPKMNGFEAAKKIREVEVENKLAKIPIVALTAFTNKNELDAAIESGCDAYLVKPIKKAQLLSDIETRLNDNPKAS